MCRFTSLRRFRERPERLLFNVHTVLEEATKISATFYKGVVVNPSGLVCPPSVGVKFPDGQVIAVDRAYLWDEGGKVCLAMFPAELQIQYKQLYEPPR